MMTDAMRVYSDLVIAVSTLGMVTWLIGHWSKRRWLASTGKWVSIGAALFVAGMGFGYGIGLAGHCP
jgi:hypothetical protein